VNLDILNVNYAFDTCVKSYFVGGENTSSDHTHKRTQKREKSSNREKKNRKKSEKNREKTRKQDKQEMADCKDFIVVIVIEGRELISADYNTRSDPYTKIKYGHREKDAHGTFNTAPTDQVKQTDCISFTLHPVWSTALFQFQRNPKHDHLLFEVWDEDAMRSHDFLGQAFVPLPPPPTKDELAKKQASWNN